MRIGSVLKTMTWTFRYMTRTHMFPNGMGSPIHNNPNWIAAGINLKDSNRNTLMPGYSHSIIVLSQMGHQGNISKAKTQVCWNRSTSFCRIHDIFTGIDDGSRAVRDSWRRFGWGKHSHRNVPVPVGVHIDDGGINQVRPIHVLPKGGL